MLRYQMRPELVQKMKKTIQRFNISSETYYHAVLLFNVIQLKKLQDQQPEFYTIPIKKRELNWDSDSDSDQQYNSYKQPEIQYIRIHFTQMPQKDKLQLTVCLFLVHKLYEPYPICLTYIMRHLEIDQRFEDYILSLEKEFLVKLAYKIQNMLPSNQALFACQLWDQFSEKISQTCIDIRFDINTLLDTKKKQIRTSHQIGGTKIQPQFKNIKNQKSFESLCQNIEKLVHNKSIYDLYLKKSQFQFHDDIPQMKKIGIAIVYATILQNSNNIFYKKYGGNQLQNIISNKTTNFIDFIFNDFLLSHYGLDLTILKQQITIVIQILNNENKEQSEYEKITIQITSAKNFQKVQQSKLANFLLRGKQMNSHENNIHNHSRKYHQKNKRNLSISSTKTDQEIIGCLQNVCIKNKCHSISDKNSTFWKDKILESTLHQSNISEKAQSINQQLHSQNQRKSYTKQNSFVDSNKILNKNHKKSAQNSGSVNKKSVQKWQNSKQKSSKSYLHKQRSSKHGKSLANSSHHNSHHKGDHTIKYKVSQFLTVDS